MRYRYEVEGDGALLDAFVTELMATLEKAGFENVLSVSSPEAPRVYEYKRKKELLSLELPRSQGGKSKIIVSSDSIAMGYLVARAALGTASASLLLLLKPLYGVLGADMEQRVTQAMDNLWKEISSNQDAP